MSNPSDPLSDNPYGEKPDAAAGVTDGAEPGSARRAPVFSRRAALALAGCAAALAGATVVAACSGAAGAVPGVQALSGALGAPQARSADGAGAAGADAGSRGVLAHQGAIAGADGGIYYVDFSSGSVVRTNKNGSLREVLYSNGQVNHLGVRFLTLFGDEVFFCDAPTCTLLAVGTRGGNARPVFTPSEPQGALPLPVMACDGVLYVSVLDPATMASSLWRVGADGEGAERLFSPPEGFYVQHLDPAAGRAYFAGVSADDVRQVRSCALDGTDELVLFSLDGVASEQSAITWQLMDGVLYVCAQDRAQSHTQLFACALDGSSAEVADDLAAQPALFDACAGRFYVVDQDTLGVRAGAPGEPFGEVVASVPKRSGGTAVALVEAGEKYLWVTTVTAGADSANEYVVYQVNVETGQVAELV